MKRALFASWPPLVSVLIVFLGLEIISAHGLIQNFVIPAPSAVFRALVREHAQLWPHILVTTTIAWLGFLLAIVIAVAMALVMARIRGLYRALYPLIVASQTIPTIVITPVIVLVFGYGVWTRLIVVVLVCFFPIALSVLQGLTTVDPDWLRLMQTMGARSTQTMRHVLIPAALPSFFAGLRISATYAVTAAVLSEWSGSGLGLGVYMMRVKRSFSYDRMFASIVWIVLLSLLMYIAAAGVEAIAMPWLRTERKIRHA